MVSTLVAAYDVGNISGRKWNSGEERSDEKEQDVAGALVVGHFKIIVTFGYCCKEYFLNCH